MAIVNPRFQDAGSKPGYADGWNVTAQSALVRVAEFDDLDLGGLGIERFNWSPEVDPSSFAFAVFDSTVAAGETYEDFYEGFVIPPYLTVWDQGFEEAAPVSPEEFDWVSWPWRSLWSQLDPGEIDTAPDTDFDISGYITLWSQIGSSETAVFDGPTNVEVFDNWTPLGS